MLKTIGAIKHRQFVPPGRGSALIKFNGNLLIRVRFVLSSRGINSTRYLSRDDVSWMSKPDVVDRSAGVFVLQSARRLVHKPQSNNRSLQMLLIPHERRYCWKNMIQRISHNATKACFVRAPLTSKHDKPVLLSHVLSSSGALRAVIQLLSRAK